MKKMNKLAAFALIIVASMNIQSCSKTQFQPANLVGTWTSTSITEETKSITESQDDPDIADEVVKTEEKNNIVYKGDNSTSGTLSSVETYDGDGSYESKESIANIKGGVIYASRTTKKTDNTTTTILDTSNLVLKKTIEVTFNKDKTCTVKSVSIDENFSENESSTHKLVQRDVRTETTIGKGSWAYIGADKNKSYKQKERIGIWFNDYDQTSNSTYTEEYTDKDLTDTNTYEDTKNVSETKTTNTVKNTEPNMIWEMVEGTKKEMKVTYFFETSGDRVTENTSTVGNVTTSSTIKSKQSNSSTSTVVFTK